jgi:hypothetical protein
MRLRRFWTTAEEALLRAQYPNTPTKNLARQLRRPLSSVYQHAASLGLTKSAAYLASPAAGRTNGRQGIGTRFPPGHVPANKGLRRPGWGPGRMKSTQFQPGVRLGVAAKNWRPVGTILTDTEGHQRIKVREAHPGEAYGFGNVRVWPLLQRHVWEQANGPIPSGHAICFKDGDKARCAIQNLECISRLELMRRNSVHRYPKALSHTIQVLGALKRQLRKRTNHAQHD